MEKSCMLGACQQIRTEFLFNLEQENNEKIFQIKITLWLEHVVNLSNFDWIKFPSRLISGFVSDSVISSENCSAAKNPILFFRLFFRQIFSDFSTQFTANVIEHFKFHEFIK